MAQVYSAPENIKTPSYSDMDNYDNECKRYRNELTQFCKENSKCKDAGEVIRFPIADGFAQYMVFTYTKLIHLEEGDAYSIPEAHARGLRKADIIHEIEFSKRRAELFKNQKPLKLF